MSRLTFKKEFQNPNEEVNCACIDMHTYNRVVNEKEEHWYLAGEVIDKLADYEDKEEQGLLISVPCKIGDIIYEPTNRNTINEYRVSGIKKEAFALWIEWKLEKEFIYQSIYGVEVGNIGKTVFLTRSEAEEALAKMGGKA